MKTMIRKFLPAGLSVFAALPAMAIEPPKDDAPPPPSVKTPASAPTSDPAREVEVAPKAAYIGIITAEVPEMLAVHLGTKPGEGVLIRELAPDGPALKSGISRYDVITRVAGQSVSSPSEFSRTIASRKPGEEVQLDLIHEGKAITKSLVLAERPKGLAHMPQPGGLDEEAFRGGNERRLRDMIEKRLNNMMKDAQEMPDLHQDAGGNLRFRSDALFRFLDNDGSIEMKSADGGKEVTVRDRQNNITWSGRWNTEEDKAAAPPEVRERIDRFNFDDGFRGNGLRFRLGPQLQEGE